MKKKTRSFILLAALAAGSAFADGNIYAVSKFAWSENNGWQNWRPAHTNVTVVKNGASGYLSGYAWSENIGWVKLGVTNGPYANTDTNNYGVNLDAAGRLSGYAWGETCGWLSFSNTSGQVIISPNTGSFDGYAWGENVGWVHFKNTALTNSYNIHTTAFSLIRKINGVLLEYIKSINGVEPWSAVSGLR